MTANEPRAADLLRRARQAGCDPEQCTIEVRFPACIAHRELVAQWAVRVCFVVCGFARQALQAKLETRRKFEARRLAEMERELAVLQVRPAAFCCLIAGSWHRFPWSRGLRGCLQRTTTATIDDEVCWESWLANEVRTADFYDNLCPDLAALTTPIGKRTTGVMLSRLAHCGGGSLLLQCNKCCWPTASLVSFLAVFNFSIQDSTGSLCLFPVSPVGQLVLRVTMPFVCIALLFIVAAAHGLL